MNCSIFGFKTFAQIISAWLIVSVALFSCNKAGVIDSINKTTLKLSVDTAKMLIQNTAEGGKPGEYAIGSKDALLTALTTSETVLNDESATQEEVDSATAQLEEAIAVYRSHYFPQIIPDPKPVPTWITPKWTKQNSPKV